MHSFGYHYWTNVSIKANTVDPGQTAHTGLIDSII